MGTYWLWEAKCPQCCCCHAARLGAHCWTVLCQHSQGCSVRASKGWQTNLTSWSLSQNYRTNKFPMTYQVVVFFDVIWFRSPARCKEASPTSLAAVAACSVQEPLESSILRSWTHPIPRGSEFVLLRPGEFKLLGTLYYVRFQCRHQKESCCDIFFLVLRKWGHL